MTEHTPGPWEYDDDGTNSGISIWASPRNDLKLIAHAWAGKPTGFPEGEMQANARLIAAAPDLLAALEALDKFYCGFAEVLRTEDFGDVLDHAIPEFREALTKSVAAIAKARGE